MQSPALHALRKDFRQRTHRRHRKQTVCVKLYAIILLALRRPREMRVSDTKVIGRPSPYSIAERRVPELIRVLGSHPAGDVSHKPGCRLPLLSARPAVTLTTLKRATTSFAAW